MGFVWMAIRIVLLGYERIAGAKISRGSPTFVAAWGFFFASFLAFFPFFSVLTPGLLLKSAVSGTVYSLSFSLYTFALANEDASVVAPLYNLNAIFLILLSGIFLGERVSVAKVLGAALMIYGVSFLKKGENITASYLNVLRSKGAVAMLLSSLLMAVGRLIDRRLTLDTPPLDYAVGVYLVISAYLLVYGFASGRKLREYVTLVRKKWLHLAIGGICNAYSYVALLNAFNYFGVSVAEPLSMLSVFITMFFARFILKERVGVRFVAATLLLLGSVLIYSS